MSILESRHRLRTLLEPVIADAGFALVAIELLGTPHRPMLRLSIDSERGVEVDDCARVHHAVTPILDANDPFPGAWDFEVSSPGIDRPVQRLEDFARFAGFRARVVLVEGLPRRRYTGELRGVLEQDVQIEVDGTVHAVPFEDIERCHLVLDLAAYEAVGRLTRTQDFQPPEIEVLETTDSADDNAKRDAESDA
jgi:ribosome maturation factor RimP